MASAEPKNLIVIVSDEHDGRYMGCAGSSLVRTPNLDRLASTGARFANAWTSSPICVPARSSLATGRYVHDVGYWDNAIAYEGRHTSWHHRLQAAGMRVESIGKLHYRSQSDPTGFARQHEPMHIQNGMGLVWGSVRDPLPPGPVPSTIFAQLGPGESSYNRYDRRIAELTVDWLEQRAAKPDKLPWALFVGFVAPHMPLVVPDRYLAHYPLDKIPLPKLMPRDGYVRHPWVERLVRFWDHDPELKTDERRKLARACYFALITMLDEHIGRILAALTRTGLEETTRVLYTSDHGDNLGARGIWNKSVLYRESTGIPMILAGPGVPRGKTCSTNVGLVDIYPTALETLGVKALAEEQRLPGRSLGEIASQSDDLNRIGFSEYHAVGADSGAYMLVAGRFKYHYYVGFRPELFDIGKDPEETRDLASDPAYKGVLAGLEARLRSMLDPEAVDRRAKDEQAIHIARFGGREVALKLGNLGITATPEQSIHH